MASKYPENTLRRQERELERLQKENFNLQLRIAAFEQQHGSGDLGDVRAAGMLREKEAELDQLKTLFSTKSEELDVAMDALTVLNAGSTESSMLEREQLADSSVSNEQAYIRELQTQCDELDRANRASKNRVQQFDDSITALQAELEKKHTERVFSAGWKTFDEMEQGPALIQFLQEQVKTLDEQIEISANKFAASDEQNEVAMAEVEFLETQLREEQDRFESMAQKNSQSIDNLTERDQAAQGTIQQLQSDVHAAKTSVQSQLNVLEDDHRRQLHTASLQHEAALRQTHDKIQTLEEQLESQNNELKKKTSSADRLAALELDAARLVKQIVELENQLEQAKADAADAIEEKKLLEGSVEIVKDEMDEAKKQAEIFKGMVNSLQETVDGLENEKSLSSGQTEALAEQETRLDEMEADLINANAHVAEAIEERNLLQGSMDIVKLELEQVQKQCDLLNEKAARLAKTDDELEKTRAHMFEAAEERNLLEASLDTLRDELEEAKTSVVHLKGKGVLAAQEHEAKMADTLLQIEEERSHEREEARAEIDKLKSGVDAHGESLAELIAEYSERIESLTEELLQAQVECDQLTDSLDERDDVNSDLVGQVKRLETAQGNDRKEIQALTTELDLFRRNDAVQSEIQTTQSVLQRENEKQPLQDRIDELTEQRDDLNEQLESQIQQVQSTNEKEEIMQQEIYELEQEIARNGEQSAAMIADKLVELENERKVALESQELAETLQSEMDSIKEELQKAKDELGEAHDQLRSVQEQTPPVAALQCNSDQDSGPASPCIGEMGPRGVVSPLQNVAKYDDPTLENSELVERQCIDSSADLDRVLSVVEGDGVRSAEQQIAEESTANSQVKSSICSTDSGPISPCIDGNDNRIVLSSRSPSESGKIELVEGERFSIGRKATHVSFSASSPQAPAEPDSERVRELEAEISSLKSQLVSEERKDLSPLRERNINVLVPESPATDYTFNKLSINAAMGPWERMIFRQIEATKRTIAVAQRNLDAEILQYKARIAGSKARAVV